MVSRPVRRWSILLGIVLVVMLFGLYTRMRIQDRILQPQEENSAMPNDPTFGEGNLTIFYFYDYQCTWCRRFEMETFPRLQENYIDTGKIKFEFLDYVVLGSDSRNLALAAECIYRRYGREQFLEYHHLAYANQQAKNSGWGSKENILDFTSTMAIDQPYLDNCITNNTFVAEVIDDTYKGMQAGITGTPTFFIDDQRLSGAQPYEVFEQILAGESVSVEEGPVST